MFWYILFFKDNLVFNCFFWLFVFLIFLCYFEVNESERIVCEDGVIVWLKVWWVWLRCVDIFNVWINLIFLCLLMFYGVIIDLMNVFWVGKVGGVEDKFDFM